MDMGLRGKTAIVTGGSGVIGQGLVLGFASEGVNVICADRDIAKGRQVEQVARDLGLTGRVLAVETDLTDRASIAAMIDICHEQFGPVDILVNNVGGGLKPVSFAELDDETFEWELALNLKAAVYATQAMADDFKKHGGVIVNISSTAALDWRSTSDYANYSAAKGYILVLTKAVAGEWADWGVRVNTICPGLTVPESVDVPGEGSLWRRYGLGTLVTPEQLEQAREGEITMAHQPVKRFGRPDDIASLAVFLSSDKASYITGQTVSVSGGAWMP